MNEHIARIKTLDDQLKTLEKMAAEGDTVAAGLSIDVTVGPRGEDERPQLQVGLCDNLDQILAAIKTGLEQARKQRVAWARSDLAELQAFLAKAGG